MNSFNPFKCLLTVVVIAAWSLCTVSCMHTVIGSGGEECYSPSGGKYGRYHVGIEAHGASARAYTDYTKKRVFLWITSTSNLNEATPSFPQRLLVHFQGKYVMRASDLGWDVHWTGFRRVEVIFFDYGPGVTSNEAKKAGIQKRVIGHIQYAANADGSEFHEALRDLPSA